MDKPESYEIDGGRFDFIKLEDTQYGFVEGARAIARITEAIESLSEEDKNRMVVEVLRNQIQVSSEAGLPGLLVNSDQKPKSDTFVSTELLARLAVDEKIRPTQPTPGGFAEQLHLRGGGSTAITR